MTTRYFRVGEGRTINLPVGLVEGTSHRRLSGPDVEHRRWSTEDPKARVLERGCAQHLIALEVDRIRTVAGADRFLNLRVLAGDLTEITAAEYSAATSPTFAASKEPTS